jgi:PAS domain S-box-containing protein
MSKLSGKSRRLRDAGDAGRSVVDSQAGADATYAESEQQFRVLAESMPQLAWMANADGWVFWYNKRWYDYTGTTLKEMEGWGWRKVHHPDHLDRVVEQLQRSWDTGEPWEDTFPLRGKEGRWRWFLSRAMPIRDEAGQVTRWFGTNTDITELRETQEALHEEAHRLETVSRIGAMIAAELDLQRLVQAVTDAGVELTGAAFGAFFYNVLHASGESYMLYTLSGAPREAFERFPMPRNTAVFEPTFRGTGVVRSDDILADPRYGKNPPYSGMPEGHLPVRSYLAVPVVSRSGEVLGGLFFGHPEPGVFAERDERVIVGVAAQAAIAIDNARLYQAAQRYSETLEQRVMERTGELAAANDELRRQIDERERAEEQLRQAQKMEAVGQLTGGIAHDFNNLLTVVIGNIETAQRHLGEGAEGRVRRAVESAMRGAQRAATLTQRLLAFSRRQPLTPGPVDVNKLVHAMSDLLNRALGETVALESVLGAGLWRVEVDSNQLEAAILNLAVNARDAMPNGGKLTIETANSHLDEAYAVAHAEVVQGQYVMIAVADTGHGMAKEILARAFEPFFTTKEAGQGTGLGLSQVYGFVKQSGGHVQIYSETGDGTTVRIYLPRLLTLAGQDEVVVDELLATGLRAETILVVEDDDDVRAHTVESLRDLGYRVIEAHDAPSALRLLELQPAPVRLLFTDVVLPGMNGRQLAEEARRRQPDLKVLYTTGYARNAIIHHGKLDPGVELISKPFAYAALAAKVRDVLDAGSTRCVLVVEDELLVRMLAVNAIRDLGYTTEEAATAAEALGKVRAAEGRYDVVLVDIGLPDKRGDALIRELRALSSDLPILIASGYDEAELRQRFSTDRRIGVLKKPYGAEHLQAGLRALGIAIADRG